MLLNFIFKKIHYWFHYKLGLCSYCHIRKYKWIYMPGSEFACDKCVPRGCFTCNAEPLDGNWENQDPKNWIEPVDKKGRKQPCCEWFHIDNFEGIEMKCFRDTTYCRYYQHCRYGKVCNKALTQEIREEAMKYRFFLCEYTIEPDCYKRIGYNEDQITNDWKPKI